MRNMVIDNYVDYKSQTVDLGVQVYHAGAYACEPGHCYGYSVRDHFLLHYVTEGCGEYCVDDKVYKLSKGDGFLILPKESTLYRASFTAPWSYQWVGFNGSLAEMLLSHVGLGKNSLIFHYDKDNKFSECLTALERGCNTDTRQPFSLAGYLLILLGQLSVNDHLQGKKEASYNLGHFNKAVKYIQGNYAGNLNISDIANYVGIDRSQLYRVFKQNCSYSPQQYLIEYRLSQACTLIKTSDLSFQEISDAVGFEFCSHFYRVFRQHYGVTPSNYRKTLGKIDAS